MSAQRRTGQPRGAQGGRVEYTEQERWHAAEMLTAAQAQARASGYRPGSREMAVLADADARYRQAKSAAYAAAAGAPRRPTVLGPYTPVEFTRQLAQRLRSLS